MSAQPVVALTAWLNRLFSGSKTNGRWLVVTVMVLFTLAWIVATSSGHTDPFWKAIGVHPLSPSFADARVITSGWECAQEGYDVLAKNPCDPWGRPLNYPRVWSLPAATGLGQEATVPLALLSIGAFAIALLMLVRKDNDAEAVVYSAAVISPAILLGIERGNIDLLVFFLVVAALFAYPRMERGFGPGSLITLVLAAVIKLYPAFSLTVLLRQNKRRALIMAGVGLASLTVYGLGTISDLKLISQGTPRAFHPSYGIAIIPLAARHELGTNAVGRFLQIHPAAMIILQVVLFLVLLGIAGWLTGKMRSSSESPEHSNLAIDAFWAGGSIYLGTFLLGSNFDYRMVFLLLTIPYTIASIRTRDRISTLSTVALAATIVALWLSPYKWPPVFLLAEASGAFIFSWIAATMWWTRPDWLGGARVQRSPSEHESRR